MTATDGRHYVNHRDDSGAFCPLSKQRQPITETTDDAYEGRAYLVADLAMQVRDYDTAVVWDYLTATPADEVQRLLMLALAAIPVEGRSVHQLFSWVGNLPIARAVTA